MLLCYNLFKGGFIVKTRYSYYIPCELLKSLKIQAIKEEVTINVLLDRLVIEYLTNLKE